MVSFGLHRFFYTTSRYSTAKYALRSLAGRYRQLSEEIHDLKAELERLTLTASPTLVSMFGVGPDTAATLLATAGSNPERLHSEAAFAALCGVSPIPASSGKTNRHRLNRGGDRQANAALHRIVVVRLRHDPRTKAYMCRRTGEGMSKTEVIRCLNATLPARSSPLSQNSAAIISVTVQTCGIYGPSGLAQRGSQARSLLCKPTRPLKREQLPISSAA